MKKALVLTAVVLTALVFAFGCADNAPTNPDNTAVPTPTPVVLSMGVMLSDFEGVTLSATADNVNAYWYAGTDSQDGGTSVVYRLEPLATPPAQSGTFSLNTWASINTTLEIGTGADYTALAPASDTAGYVTNSLIFEDAVSFTMNASVYWMQIQTQVAVNRTSLYIYNTAGDFIYANGTTPSITWYGNSILFDSFTLPSGAAYTREDVIKSVKKLVWVHKLFTYGTASQELEINIDAVQLYGPE